MNVALHPIQGIELFSGVGMLGEGLRAGLDYLGFAYRTVCHVEREAYAASVLVARMEEGSMDAAPVWSDVCTFDARAWRGKVDCVVAGFPCQDLSVAGKRAGLDGKRSGLFFEVTRIAADSGAWLIVLENVAGIASATATVMDEEEGELDERAAARVLGELADLGWDAEWITISASDVGASHGRARWFCIGWKLDNAGRVQRRAGYDKDRSGRKEARRNEADHRSSDGSIDVDDSARHVWNAGKRQSGSGRRVCEAGNELADANSAGLRASGRPRINLQGDARTVTEQRGAGVAHPVGTGSQERIGGGKDDGAFQQAIGTDAISICSAFPLFAPGPADPRWADIIADEPHRAPALEPTFRGVVNGLAFDMGDCRALRLKCGGNGVVALQAATALVVLLRRSGIMNSIIADMAITRRAA